ncbi:MAG: DNA polymerase IV [Planctomycetota bacterium]
MTRNIIHIDIDAFLASVEQIREPSLIGRPVVVGGERGERGLVLSSSYEARARGVRPGLSLGQAERLLPGGIFLKGDYQEARRLSDLTWEICRRYTPLVEVTSLDDCYLDVTGTERLFGPAVEVASRIRREVSREVGFRISLGTATNRTVARVATCFAKPGGVVSIPPGGEAAFLRPLPLRRLPGVGHKTEKRLRSYNLLTIGDLAGVPRELLVMTFGDAAGSALADRAKGRDDREVKAKTLPRSVSRSTSFDPETADRTVIEGMLFYLTERAARMLREAGQEARTVAVAIRYVDGAGGNRSKALARPSNRERDIYPEARRLLDGLFTRRVRLKWLGVALTGLMREGAGQQDLFAERERRRSIGLVEGIDGIRERFGFRAVTAGRSIDLLGRYAQNEHGFVLKTPSLTR